MVPLASLVISEVGIGILCTQGTSCLFSQRGPVASRLGILDFYSGLSISTQLSDLYTVLRFPILLPHSFVLSILQVPFLKNNGFKQLKDRFALFPVKH